MHPATRTIITFLALLGLLMVVVNAMRGDLVSITGGGMAALGFGYLALFAKPYENGEE